MLRCVNSWSRVLRARLGRAPLLAAWMFVPACAELILLEDAVAPDAADAGSGADAALPDAPDAGPLPNLDGPEVQITVPDDGTRLQTATVRIEGTAADADGLASVAVQVASNVPRLAASDDGFATWWVEVPVPAGAFEVRAWGFDAEGLRSTNTDAVLLQGPAVGVDDAAPEVVIVAPADGAQVLQPTALLRGTARDDGGVVRVEVYRNGTLLDDAPVETDSFFADWVRLVPLLPGEANVIEVVAIDRRGLEGRASVTLWGRAVDDRVPPELVVAQPQPGAVLDVATVQVTGTARDALGVRTVELRTRRETGAEVVLGPWVAAQTTDAWVTFDQALTFEPGPATLEVRAIDQSGLTTLVTVPVVIAADAEWGAAQTVRLRLRPEEPQEPATLRIPRDRISEVLSESIQREILMLELDPTDLLRNTMNTIKTACGTAWRNDSPNPNHDCSLTELGRTFVGSDGTWRTSPEYALVRLLTMTPANVQVAGTSIAGLQELADGSFFGITIGGGFSQILADSLGIARTTEITGTDAVVQSLRENLIATHPAASPGGLMPVTLYDALQDMRPLGERFGPVDGHPGVVDPASPAYGQVFTEDSAMVLTATSNLQWIDGVDLASGKEFMAVVVDRTGPTFNDVIEFDFSSDETFRVEGIVDRPVTDMRFVVHESDAFIASCNGSDTCVGNLPGSPTSTASYWAQPAYLLETIVARAAYLQYASRRSQRCYINFLGCQAEVSIGQGSYPAGWTEFNIILGLGNPPRDQYIWELITEVGQVALHRVPSGTIAEGAADVAFDLRGIEVGITAAELQEQVRPYLQGQAAQISALVLGDYRTNNGNLDFYYRTGADGLPYLFFVAPSDPRPVDDGYPYTRPGFFADDTLSPGSRVSQIAIPGSGDDVHHKLRVTPGVREVFVEDRAGQVWRVELSADTDPTELVVRLSPRIR